jgi:hypothetical protein
MLIGVHWGYQIDAGHLTPIIRLPAFLSGSSLRDMQRVQVTAAITAGATPSVVG